MAELDIEAASRQQQEPQREQQQQPQHEQQQQPHQHSQLHAQLQGGLEQSRTVGELPPICSSFLIESPPPYSIEYGYIGRRICNSDQVTYPNSFLNLKILARLNLRS